MFSSFYTIFFDWVYVILACPTHCSANFGECNKWWNDTRSEYFLYVFIVLNKFFDKTSNFDHVCFIFIIILNILHVSLKLLSTLSLRGNCRFKKPSDVISDISTTVLSFLYEDRNNCQLYSNYLHLYFIIFLILCLYLDVVKLNMSTLS